MGGREGHQERWKDQQGRAVWKEQTSEVGGARRGKGGKRGKEDTGARREREKKRGTQSGGEVSQRAVRRRKKGEG